MSILASDDFERGDSTDLGANWDPVVDSNNYSDGFQIVSGKVVNRANHPLEDADAGEVNNSVAWPDDQYSEVTIGANIGGAGGIGWGVWVRLSGANGTLKGYRLTASNASWVLYRADNATSWSSLDGGTGTTVTTGDKLRLSVVGTAWSALKNGVEFANGTNSDVTTGKPGIAYGSTTTGGSVSAWEGGDFAVTAQLGRPGSDLASGGWTPSSGGDLYAMVDEVSASDADYILSAASPTADVARLRFSGLVTPANRDGHIIRYRIRGDGTCPLTVDLYDGDGTTLIKSWTHTPAPAAWTTYEQTLTNGEASTITDYPNLEIRVTAN